MRLQKNQTTMGQTRIYFQPDPDSQKVITVAWPADAAERGMWDQILAYVESLETDQILAYVEGLEADLDKAEQEAIQVHALREELAKARKDRDLHLAAAGPSGPELHGGPPGRPGPPDVHHGAQASQGGGGASLRNRRGMSRTGHREPEVRP